jgi:hypothetical protein
MSPCLEEKPAVLSKQPTFEVGVATLTDHAENIARHLARLILSGLQPQYVTSVSVFWKALTAISPFDSRQIMGPHLATHTAFQSIKRSIALPVY